MVCRLAAPFLGHPEEQEFWVGCRPGWWLAPILVTLLAPGTAQGPTLQKGCWNCLKPVEAQGGRFPWQLS